MDDVDKIEDLMALLRRCERALGEENVVALDTLSVLGGLLRNVREYNAALYDKAIELWERCLMGRMNVFGEQHKDTLMSLNNLGIVYQVKGDYVKAL
ncbi:hypothetical protein TrLO_g2413 [Triparma laevis f. longispina]|uniref:Kinesin light chain n=1 Tax=Triparma laevis f. longispina TaxID=1714387 RepID=A0A9W7KWK4_9STRA|nr:hypothetical protein TrLO_g2413 [Triparma laevis f. longispina]